MEKIKEIGCIEVMKDPNLKDLIPKKKKQMASIDIEELVPLANVVIQTLFEGMSILIENSSFLNFLIEFFFNLYLICNNP